MTGDQARCESCRCFVYEGQRWCRNCAPRRPCRDYPPTCAPGRTPDGSYVCCMDTPL